jgi:twitching motility protein PilT
MARIDPFLKHLKASGGSDMHFVSGLAPRMRVHGALAPFGNVGAPSADELRALLKEVTTEEQWRQYQRDLELDFAHNIPGVGRFRANYFVQESGAAAVFRIIPETIQSLADLRIPKIVERFAHLRSGLVLVTGPTGSGKSTTLAAIIDAINQSYAKHIITIEDPIEFVHPNKMSVLSQREVGTHCKDFAAALRAAIRQNADVILVGELRGRETELAILAAEMGALVFGTLHTNSAVKTIDRLVDIFPIEQQEQIRVGLAEALAGVVSQVLVPAANGKGRIAAVEVLAKTSGLANIIREGNTPQLINLIQSGKAHGMQTMDDALDSLVSQGLVHPKDAYQRAADKSRFEALLEQGMGEAPST